MRARNTLKRRLEPSARKESERSTRRRQRHRVLASSTPSSLLSWEVGGEGEDRPPPPRLALPSTLPTPRSSPPFGALCKSPHMLPRVSVSQRHSRASFYTHWNVVTDCRKGTIKRVLSLSLPPSPTQIQLPIRTSLLHTGIRDGRTVCTYACAREGVLFSASLGGPTQSQSRNNRLAKVEEQLIEGATTGHEREKRKGAIRHRSYPISTCIGNLFFFYFYIYVHRAILWNLASSEVLTLPRLRLICYFLPSFLSSRASVE